MAVAYIKLYEFGILFLKVLMANAHKSVTGAANGITKDSGKCRASVTNNSYAYFVLAPVVLSVRTSVSINLKIGRAHV